MYLKYIKYCGQKISNGGHNTNMVDKENVWGTKMSEWSTKYIYGGQKKILMDKLCRRWTKKDHCGQTMQKLDPKKKPCGQTIQMLDKTKLI